MIAYLLDKIASFRSARPAPPTSIDATAPARHELKGIPSDAFFFDPKQPHPDGSSCGAGCGSGNHCGSAYPGGNS